MHESTAVTARKLRAATRDYPHRVKHYVEHSMCLPCAGDGFTADPNWGRGPSIRQPLPGMHVRECGLCCGTGRIHVNTEKAGE